MADEAKIKEALHAKLGLPDDKVRVQRERRVWVEIPYAELRGALEYVHKELGFTILCTITGLDDGEQLSILYHLAQQAGTVLNVKTSVPKAKPVVRTVSDLYGSCVSYERELVDLFGFEVEGLPPGNRYPLPEDWPAGQHPLRKDWKPEKAGSEEHRNA